MLPEIDISGLDLVERHVNDALRSSTKRPLIVGICGAQGSGKSTIARALHDKFVARDLKVALFSLDDLYLSREDRKMLAAEHPLFEVRGVPGTHDVALGEQVIAACGLSGRVLLPRFSKERDAPCRQSEWVEIEGPVDLILFEGWCVGALPQPAEALLEPVNALERYEDDKAVWRSSVNHHLAGEYQRLFAHIDQLVLLAAPSFDVVATWRQEQEHILRDRLRSQGSDLASTLSDSEVERFVQHYQRITQHILAEMPDRANLVVWLDAHRKPVAPREG